eukprot:scaffold152668_cov36-Tisochrysis_lutea.AAC.1
MARVAASSSERAASPTALIWRSCARQRSSSATTSLTRPTSAPRRRCDSRTTSGSPPASTRNHVMSSIDALTNGLFISRLHHQSNPS